MRRRALMMFAASCAAAMAMAGTASASTGNSGAAQECQHGGYTSMFRSDGSSFKNAGACVSYFAQGGTTACGSVPGVSGCVIFDNAEAPAKYEPGMTIEVNGAVAFSTTACEALACTAPNDYATGGGTVVFYDNDVQAGSATFTVDDTPGSDEGLVETWCASGPQVEVQASVNGTLSGSPLSGTWTMIVNTSGFGIISDQGPLQGANAYGPMTGLTISC